MEVATEKMLLADSYGQRSLETYLCVPIKGGEGFILLAATSVLILKSWRSIQQYVMVRKEVIPGIGYCRSSSFTSPSSEKASVEPCPKPNCAKALFGFSGGFKIGQA